MYKSPNWKRTYHFHGLKRRLAGGKNYIYKEAQNEVRKVGRTHSVNCNTKFGLEIWTFI